MTFRSSFLGPVLAAIAAITVAFGAVIVISQYAAHDIRSAVRDITVNATPSVEHITELRGALWQLQLALLHAREELAEGEEVPMDGIATGLARIDNEWAQYVITPLFRGEAERRSLIAPDLALLKDHVIDARDALLRGDLETSTKIINGDLADLFARTAADLRDLAVLNLRGGHAAALRAEEARLTSQRIALILGILGFVLAALLGWTVSRSLKRGARLRAEHDQLQQERSSELEAFAARIAHDLRGPIAGALVSCELAARGRTSAADRIRTNLLRMSQLVDGLYEFARADAAAPSPGRTPLREAVHLALEEIEPRAQMAGITVSADDIPDAVVRASPGVVQSILMNLLSNAVKYAGRGARVTVCAVVGEKVHFEVRDTGVGIPDDMQDRIFKPYVRAGDQHNEGLGLGLATVKRLVDRQGGACGLRSSRGKGSVFWVELPAALDAATGAVPSPRMNGAGPSASVH